MRSDLITVDGTFMHASGTAVAGRPWNCSLESDTLRPTKASILRCNIAAG